MVLGRPINSNCGHFECGGGGGKERALKIIKRIIADCHVLRWRSVIFIHARGNYFPAFSGDNSYRSVVARLSAVTHRCMR